VEEVVVWGSWVVDRCGGEMDASLRGWATMLTIKAPTGTHVFPVIGHVRPLARICSNCPCNSRTVHTLHVTWHNVHVAPWGVPKRPAQRAPLEGPAEGHRSPRMAFQVPYSPGELAVAAVDRADVTPHVIQGF
jgi:hypothetical protein